MFGVTVPILCGVVAAIACGMLVSTLHAWLSISIRADQIISGTIINILALGLTAYLNRLLITPNPRLGAGIFHPLVLPDILVDLPLVGWIIKGFFAQGPITISVIFLVVFLQLWLFRSRWGLRTRAVGEHPKAAETVGIDVIKLRYRNVILGGIFAGLAGAYLTLEQSGSFQNNMTARARLHRPGRGHLRALDATRSVRRGAALRGIGSAAGGDRAEPTDRRARQRRPRHPARVLRIASLRRHPRRPGRRGRPERRTGRRRQAVRARSADLRRDG